MSNFENAVSELLKNKLIVFISVLIIVLATISHVYRCLMGQNSRFFWGLNECQECKNEPVKVIRDTIYRDTCIARVIYKTPSTNAKSQIYKYDLSNAKIDAPAQIGDNNTQNNQFGLKPREVSDKLIKDIIKAAPSTSTSIGIARRSDDSESYDFATKIVSALNQRGYKNAFVNGIKNELIVGGDPEQVARERKEIRFKLNNGQLDILIPTNQ